MGRTSAWPRFPAKASHAPGTLSHMSEPHALMGEAQICNYFVPVERTEPSCTCSNSCVCGNAGRLCQRVLEYLVAVAIPVDVSVFGCKAEIGLAQADEHH